MADIKEFALPEFLKDQSETEIHKEMLEMLKTYVPDMDLTEGSIAWDFTRPAAKEKAMMVNFILVEAIKNTFPMWAYGRAWITWAYPAAFTESLLLRHMES